MVWPAKIGNRRRRIDEAEGFSGSIYNNFPLNTFSPSAPFDSSYFSFSLFLLLADIRTHSELNDFLNRHRLNDPASHHFWEAKAVMQANNPGANANTKTSRWLIPRIPISPSLTPSTSSQQSAGAHLCMHHALSFFTPVGQHY
jgi:hypothetical protein